MQERLARADLARLSALFFIHSMAMGAWFVPLATVLDAYGYRDIKPFAFATSAVAAFISPLLFGAIADRHLGPVPVLRGLSIATAGAMAAACWSINQHAPSWLVLALIQLHSLCASPTWGISSAIVLGKLSNPQRQFGPLRSLGSIGWIAGCLVVSGFGADRSVRAGFIGATTWIGLAVFTLFLPNVLPPKSSTRLSLRERLGWDALSLLKQRDHRVVFITAALFSIPMAAFYPYTPTHMQSLGLVHTTAWMSMGQITEVAVMFALGMLLARWRFKWVLLLGLAFGLARYCLYTLNSSAGVLLGLSLHGLIFSLFFITMQIYLDQRIAPEWRARAQALYVLVTGGIGNLLGYLATGWWYRKVTLTGETDWRAYWGALALMTGAVGIYFLFSYQGRQPGLETRETTP